ncbi:HlyD family efflux transporter periplasmic adaptor subunit [uncultured Paludibaculum sp.]|uniref:HlyD family secretion protein n=1 Tax=uncultured Paludibaculum sp. TaxID=1765020 RepID=UPI002AAC0F31|nr:HlyD family efflux transporter periplasmic adaptor subunit [uncultured Paludibaculum sp.]
MDVPREGAKKKKIIRRAIIVTLIVAAIPLITYGLSRLKPAAPSVEGGTLWTDTVKRGPMIRQVRGLGTLVPEDTLLIPAINEGRVQKIILRPGALVQSNTVILVLSNPELELAAEDLKWQVKAAEATMQDLRIKLETAKLDLRSAVARVESEFVQAKLKAERDEALGKEGLTPDLTIRLSRAAADEAGKRFEIDKKRLEISASAAEAQIAAQQVGIEKLRAAYALKQQQVDNLKVKAGFPGVLQQMAVEVGQQIPVGTILAKVVQPTHLKAEIKIPETQAKDITIGQLAQVDTHNGVIDAKVSRIDPAAINGNVTVDLRLEGELPLGARPDLSVDGTVELERLSDVLYVMRPVFGQPNSVIGLFKVTPDGKEASRVQVRIGRVSVQTVEVLDGLKVGDRVVLSDMAAWDGHDRLRLN